MYKKRENFDTFLLRVREVNIMTATEKDTADLRKMFEHWMSDEGAQPRAIERSGESYQLMIATTNWRAWQACARALQPIIDALQKELDEQCRLNGMGSEREAKLLAEIDGYKTAESQCSDQYDKLYTENTKLRARVGELTDALTNARDWFESQAKSISKGNGSPFELIQVRDQRDACDAALAKSQRGEQ